MEALSVFVQVSLFLQFKLCIGFFITSFLNNNKYCRLFESGRNYSLYGWNVSNRRYEYLNGTVRIYTPRHLRRIQKIVFEILYEITKYILSYLHVFSLCFGKGVVRIFLADCVIWREYCGGRGVLHTCAILSSTSLIHFDLLSYYPMNRLPITSWREDFHRRGCKHTCQFLVKSIPLVHQMCFLVHQRFR